VLFDASFSAQTADEVIFFSVHMASTRPKHGGNANELYDSSLSRFTFKSHGQSSLKQVASVNAEDVKDKQNF
jgi:hypothetical protein